MLSEIRAKGLEQVMIISLTPGDRAGAQPRAGDGDGLPVVGVARLAQPAAGDSAALSRQRSTVEVIREAHERGLKVYVWTVNDAGGMIEMIGRGADGIITDDPIVASRVRDELKSLTSTELVLLRFSDALTNEEAKDEIPGVQ